MSHFSHFLGPNMPDVSSGKQLRHDLVGPADPVSKLRPIKIFIPENETTLEQRLRLRREEVYAWNQSFWTKHNISFVEVSRFKVEQTLFNGSSATTIYPGWKESILQEQKKFVETTMKELGINSPELMKSEKMSEFYKKFLDSKWQTHYNYNWQVWLTPNDILNSNIEIWCL